MYSHVKDPTGVDHRWVFDFEMLFFNSTSYETIEQSMKDWWWTSFIYGLFYIISIFLGQRWMSKRKEKFELRRLLFIWNFSLSLFSFWGAYRCVPEFVYTLKHHGFIYSVCDSTYKQGITGLWVWLFMASKVPETIDTLFIVLRRQQLIFLHWYHHVSVMIYCFYSYTFFASTGRWFVTMNYCIHALMYGYFALRAIQIRVPRSIQQMITILQLLQMLVGCLINLSAFDSKRRGYVCDTSTENIILSLVLYASYLVLFAHFFYQTYVRQVKVRRD